jgi:hypothetical protein
MATTFGCTACYGEDPAEALRHRRHGVKRDVVLVDDPHFIVAIGHCGECSQSYLSIFTEFVDWQGGDDAQYTTIVPLTGEETAALVGRGGDLDLRALGALGEGRRYLMSDWPTGASEQRTRWANGPFRVMEGH